MKIELHPIKIKDVYDKYIDKDEEGVYGYHGLLNIRPAYQRNFVYSQAQQNEVIRSVKKGFPLNVMYWSKNSDGTYELLDGQQRTLSICLYKQGVSSVDGFTFNALPEDIKAAIDNYELQVYTCEGTESEKLDWFRVVNIAGEKLTDQELRNSVYTGPWLSEAKRYFSKNQGPATMQSKYLKLRANQQEYLEWALKKIIKRDGIATIEDYMSRHRYDPDASELIEFYEAIFYWVRKTFPTYRKEMQKVDWGNLYITYGDKDLNPEELDRRIAELMKDPEVQNKAGIYPYVLSGEEKELSLRAFDDSDKRSIYEAQEGTCPLCGKHFEYEEMEGDHKVPWSVGGKTKIWNLWMLCKTCNKQKSNKMFPASFVEEKIRENNELTKDLR